LPGDGRRLAPTRIRDVVLVAVVAGAVAYLLTRWNYSVLPVLPRFAGATAALIGAGEIIAGVGLRRRIRAHRDGRRRPPELPPVPPLTAARALAVAKASALAGAALVGLWGGLLGYVAPRAALVPAAAADTVTAIVGVIGALILLGAALFLENSCRTTDDDPSGSAGVR
jgi:hypothetical protein